MIKSYKDKFWIVRLKFILVGKYAGKLSFLLTSYAYMYIKSKSVISFFLPAVNLLVLFCSYIIANKKKNE